MPRLFVNSISGSPYQQGWELGQLQKDRIRGFLNEKYMRLGNIASKEALNSYRTLVHDYRKVIERDAEVSCKTICGVADGADIALEDAYGLQLRRELIGYNSVPTSGDCTSFVDCRATNPVGGQTIDLNLNMHDQIVVNKHSNKNGHGILMVSFTGLLGYLGINSAGIGVLINLILAGNWRNGVPPYLVVRELLETKSIDDCIKRLKSLDIASSRSLTIFDDKTVVNIEFVRNDVSIRQCGELYSRANHIQSPSLISQDKLNPFAKVSSMRREQHCMGKLKEADRSIAGYMSILASHYDDGGSICVHSDRIENERTVAGVVLDPINRAIHIRPGYPCINETQTFAL